MKSVIHSSRIANKNDQDYEARSNIMWSATWALNTLAAVSLPYYKYILKDGLAMSLLELGVTEDMIQDIVKGTVSIIVISCKRASCGETHGVLFF